MTKLEFYEWVQTEGCNVKPKEGFNISCESIEITNKKTRAYAYLSLPIDQRIMPQSAIREIVGLLGIPFPPKSFFE